MFFLFVVKCLNPHDLRCSEPPAGSMILTIRVRSAGADVSRSLGNVSCTYIFHDIPPRASPHFSSFPPARRTCYNHSARTKTAPRRCSRRPFTTRRCSRATKPATAIAPYEFPSAIFDNWPCLPVHTAAHQAASLIVLTTTHACNTALCTRMRATIAFTTGPLLLSYGVRITSPTSFIPQVHRRPRLCTARTPRTALTNTCTPRAPEPIGLDRTTLYPRTRSASTPGISLQSYCPGTGNRSEADVAREGWTGIMQAVS